MPNSTRMRLDVLMAQRGLAESREKAKRMVMAGEVTVDGQVVVKPGVQVPVSSQIQVQRPLAYVSRGGVKLEGALDALEIDVQGLVAADVGASTGGFTDCLLQRGARRVYAIDVGYGQLAWALRHDPRVVVMERTNIRYLEGLPEPVDLATIDASFISLTLVLPAVRWFLKGDGQVVALIKPQFEAGRENVGKGGVVRDPEIHGQVLERLLHWSLDAGWGILGLTPSPLEGPAGNVEFFVWLSAQPEGVRQASIGEMVARCLKSVSQVH